MSLKIRDIVSSTKKVIRVNPSSTLSEAISKMLLNDFSQLPVMSSEKRVDGIISWKTIGTSESFGVQGNLVRDCMDENVTILMASDNLLDSVKFILEKEFVLIRDNGGAITGIVTLFDIAFQFKYLSEPFIELEAIESSLRKFIDHNVDSATFLEFCKRRFQDIQSQPRIIKTSSDLTFGEYLRIIENKELWERFEINLDRNVFLEKLRIIRDVRNEIMHFRAAGIKQENLKHLKDVSKFFRILEKMDKG